MRVGQWVALVCFVSLALLGWWALMYGVSWMWVFAAVWFLLVGACAGIQPGEWKKKGGG